MISGQLAGRAEQLVADRVAFVHATVVRTARPSSMRPGDSALVLADGTIEGFVGGTCAEESVRLHAARALETGEAVLLRLVPGGAPGETRDQEGIVVAHNPCLSGGALEIFLEPLLPALRVIVAGSTPIARALEVVGRAAGYHVVRGEAAELEPQPTDAALIVASHGSDEAIALVRALEAGVGYVALVASGPRGEAVRDSLPVPGALRAQVHTPAGLAVGARTPAEVAISILAELVADRAAHPADRASPVATAIDPVCGMEVLAGAATPHLDVGGERVYFCREECRSAYAALRPGDVTPT